MALGTKHANRLKDEASPYLQQHAHNPVDWYPWGHEAFEKARREDKPVFLSIGYSTCHWCHVMAHESFEDKHIADLLNQYFVSIKVDREERPDIDSVFMDFVQALTGSGGWPLSVFLTPEGNPFYGGTYFPPRDSFGRPGFNKLLLALHEAWQERREEMVRSGKEIATRLQVLAHEEGGGPVAKEALDDAYRNLSRSFDDVFGGFNHAPKFPQPSALSFLLVYHYRTRDPRALHMAELTLTKMAAGGIYDHLGGGFHRYSVDRQWLVPHFEKMLYDQALLARAYTQAYQVTAKAGYAEAVAETLRYVLRDLADGAGFASAEDADTQGHEGLFYLWDYDEIIKTLGKEAGAVFASFYGVSREGNFEQKNILHRVKTVHDVASETGRTVKEVQEILKGARKELFDRRQRRIRPHRDNKIIAGWNGLMVSALATAGAVFRQASWLAAADRTADFLLKTLAAGGRLKRYAMDGTARELAVQEDYACVIQGLLDLYEAKFEPERLRQAWELAEQMVDLFEDTDHGGFYMTGRDAEKVIVRQKKNYDGAVPSGNSTAALVLLRLGELTGEAWLSQRGEAVLRLFSQTLLRHGVGLTEMLSAADFSLGPRRQIVVAGARDDTVSREFMRVVHSRFMPRTVRLLHPAGSEGRAIEDLVPSIQSQAPTNGAPTVYLCENFACQEPITDPHELCRKLEV